MDLEVRRLEKEPIESYSNRKGRHKSRESGFGMIDMVVSIGLVGIMATAMIGASDLIFRMQQATSAETSFNELISSTSLMLSEPSLCLQNFGGLELSGQKTAVGSPVFFSSQDESLMQAGVAKGPIRLEQLEIERLAPTTAGSDVWSARLRLTVENSAVGQSMLLGSSRRARSFPMYVKLDAANKIVGCYSHITPNKALQDACAALQGTVVGETCQLPVCGTGTYRAGIDPVTGGPVCVSLSSQVQASLGQQLGSVGVCGDDEVIYGFDGEGNKVCGPKLAGGPVPGSEPEAVKCNNSEIGPFGVSGSQTDPGANRRPYNKTKCGDIDRYLYATFYCGADGTWSVASGDAKNVTGLQVNAPVCGAPCAAVKNDPMQIGGFCFSSSLNLGDNGGSDPSPDGRALSYSDALIRCDNPEVKADVVFQCENGKWLPTVSLE